ncbi:MAG: hypothetical protein MUF27_03345 [Acidobacteria bacterium]|jgi:phage terminase small subunit|nr:hypothetical protein [Acidobacteriota bacterium]
MGARGPIRGTPAARYCGPSGLTAQGGTRAKAIEADPLPTEPPSWLPARAKALWRATLPQITARATRADREVFAQWCLACAAVRDLAPIVEKDPARGDELRAQLRAAAMLARELGLTPASRSRIPEVEVVEKQQDEKARREATIAALIR